MKMPSKSEVEKFLSTFPGKRGVDVPEQIFDKIHPVANGITQQIWGDAPWPHQIQYLYEQGHHTPNAIHDVYGAMPHPHAPSTTVAEYQKYGEAKTLYDKHQKPKNAR